jgi:hypothetical protein
VQPAQGNAFRITCAALSSLVVLGCVALAVAGVLLTRLAAGSLTDSVGASETEVNFCSGLVAQNYAAVYSQLSLNQHKRYSLDQFIQHSVAQQQQSGAPMACDVVRDAIFTQGNTHAGIVITLIRGAAAPVQGTLYLMREGNTWRVDNADPILNVV